MLVLNLNGQNSFSGGNAGQKGWVACCCRPPCPALWSGRVPRSGSWWWLCRKNTYPLTAAAVSFAGSKHWEMMCGLFLLSVASPTAAWDTVALRIPQCLMLLSLTSVTPPRRAEDLWQGLETRAFQRGNWQRKIPTEAEPERKVFLTDRIQIPTLLLLTAWLWTWPLCAWVL